MTTLLGAAVRLAAERGPASVTMSAVARAVGAPSGSVYHRFPRHAALLAELWLYTVNRFQEGFLAALGQEPAEEAAVAAALHVVGWAREHPQEARILLYGPADFALPDWPAEATRRLKSANRQVKDALDALAKRLGYVTALDRERLTLCTIDLPYAFVRRHLLNAEEIPASAEDTLKLSAESILSPNKS